MTKAPRKGFFEITLVIKISQASFMNFFLCVKVFPKSEEIIMPKKKKSYFVRLLKVCRQEWSRNDPMRKLCFVLNKRTTEDGMHKWECNTCNKWFALSEVDCDHIEPIVNTIPQNLEEFLVCLKRLHSPSENLQILCKPCHKVKTKEELVFKKDLLLIKLVEGFLINSGWNVRHYKINILDKRELRQLSNLFCKIQKISNEKLIMKNEIKIKSILEKCLSYEQK